MGATAEMISGESISAVCGQKRRKYTMSSSYSKLQYIIAIADKKMKNVTLNAKGSESLPTHYFFTQKQRKRPYPAAL